MDRSLSRFSPFLKGSPLAGLKEKRLVKKDWPALSHRDGCLLAKL
jgi:hypothetical protein